MEFAGYLFMATCVIYMIFDYSYKTALTNALGAILKKLDIVPERKKGG